MTDNKNETENDPTLQDEAFEAGESAPNEEWQGELPPEDDFHDQEMGNEEAVDETLSDEPMPEEADDNTAQVEKSKRGKTILFGVIVVGVLFVGGMAYLQFGVSGVGNGGLGPLPVANVLNMSDLKSSAPAATPTRADNNAPPVNADGSVDLGKMYSGGARSDGKVALPNGDNAGSAAEKPVVGTSSDILTSSSADAPMVPPPLATKPHADTKTPPVLDQTAPPARSMDMPVPAVHADALKSVPVALSVDPLSAKQPAAVGANNTATVEMEAKLKGMMDQIETLKKSLGDVTAQNTSLLSRLETLQQETAEKEKAAASKPALISAPVAAKKETASVNVQPAVGGVDAAFDQATEMPKPLESQTKMAKQEKHAKAAAKKASVGLKNKKAEKSARWVLRAATPDAVWVSVTRDSTELRRVAIGESLTGLGKVKEIKQNGDHWEVIGSSGVLR